MLAKTRRAAALALPALMVGLLTLPTQATAQTGNLAPNPCFQLSLAEGSVIDPSPAHGTLIQPVLPTGWVSEGSAGLFDYADIRADVVGLGGRTHTCGALPRFVAVSIPASGKNRMCDAGPCVDFQPATDAKWTAALAYSVNPAWRTAVPITVSGNRSYTLAADTQHDFVSVASGSFLAIRWLDGNGVPLRLDKVDRVQRETDPVGTGPWTRVSMSRTSPPAARSAVLLLGHLDDLWAGQVRFDNVSFS